ncbi:MAG TPA: VWA domain-containing protein [Pyrinomonadaceae bacterium]|nr:VWA domain-containing protein [Pyrinomonadaceae bacterium]
MKHLHRTTARLVFSCLALIVALSTLHTAKAQQPANTPAPPSSQSHETPDSVMLTVTVTDKRHLYIAGLEKSHFTVLDNKTPLEITHFSAEDEPVSIGIILDASQSMAGRGNMRRLSNEVAEFIRQSNGENEYFLIAFNERPQLLVDWTRGGQAILDRIESIEPKRDTAFYDACYLGVEKVKQGKHRKRALLIIGDGEDNHSRYGFQESRKLLKESDVLLYSVILSGNNDPASTLGLEGFSILGELSQISGGLAYHPNSNAELTEVFERFALELHNQYRLGFKLADGARDGKWHQLKVKVKAPPSCPASRCAHARASSPPGTSADSKHLDLMSTAARASRLSRGA